MGPPMVGAPPSACSSAAVDQMVASVGPYRLKKRRPGAQRATSSGEQASPATVMVARSGSGAAGSAPRAVGVSVTTLMRSRCRKPSRSGPGSRSARSPRHRVAPDASAMTISKVAASKLSDENCSTRSAGPTPNMRCWQPARLTRPRCASSAPLGVPVEPEV